MTPAYARWVVSRRTLLQFAGAVLLTHALPAFAAEKALRKSRQQTGLASYYSRKFDGKETAAGTTFDNEELVAAHWTYPLGTRVKVTNLENDETVTVTIKDRGPSEENRREGVIIDLSRAAATRLKMKEDGRVKVRLDVVALGDNEREDTHTEKKAAEVKRKSARNAKKEAAENRGSRTSD